MRYSDHGYKQCYRTEAKRLLADFSNNDADLHDFIDGAETFSSYSYELLADEIKNRNLLKF